MTGIAFVTDLHLRSADTKTEPHLLRHQDELLQHLKDIVVQGSQKYDRMIVVFMGDMTDRSIADSIMFTKLCMYFGELKRIADLYFVIGNHEESFKLRHNLFWHLKFGDNLKTPSKIRPVEPVFEVVDYFDIDKTRIILNHHGRDINVDTTNVDNVVVASHNNLSHEELRALYTNAGIDTQEEYIEYTNMFGFLPETDKLKYVFKGHQHMLFGQYRIKENWGNVDYDFVFYDLSSLGRPKYTEFLQPNKRDIPVLEVEGSTINLVNNYIELYDKEELNFDEIEERHEKYQKTKQFSSLRRTVFTANNVMNELVSLYSVDPRKLGILQHAREGTPIQDMERCKTIILGVEVK